MNVSPPKYALRFLRWFCREDFLEEIEGDLLEMYDKQYEENLNKARWIFFLNVLWHFRPAFIKSFTPLPITSSAMYQSYFKIAWRNLVKQKQYAIINIGGLAIGLTCFLLIFLYAQHELSYDRFHSNADRTYRVYQHQEGSNYMGSDYFAVTPPGLANVLVEEIPEIAQATSLQEQTSLLGKGQSHYYEKGLWADANFFNVFSFEFLQGDPQTALASAESIVLTESLARKIFGDSDIVGELLTFEHGQTFISNGLGQQSFIVTGVIEDVPLTSSLRFSYLTSFLSNSRYVHEVQRETWDTNMLHTFFLLTDNVNPVHLSNKLSSVHQKYVDYGEDFPYECSYQIQPLTDLHLETKLNFDMGVKGNPRYLQLFSLIAGLVLLLACVNYVNLAIARSIKRTREVGLRKVVGARRWQLVGQFIGESVFIAGLALLLALGLTYLLLPAFGDFLERNLTLNPTKPGWLLPGLIGLAVIVGILSGSYPAFIMASLRPVQGLRGKMGHKFSGLSFQRWLLVGQYTVSIVLIIGSIIIYRQFQFIQNKELGFDKDHVITIQVPDRGLSDRYETLKQEWLSYPRVMAVSGDGSLPTNIDSNVFIDDKAITESPLNTYQAHVSYDYLKVFGIQLLAGRFFSPDFATDAQEAVVLNETAVRALGWTPEEAIGKQFVRDSIETIIGVVEDFHMHSLHSPIAPLMLQLNTGFNAYFSVKVQPTNLSEMLTYLEASAKSYSPYPIHVQFLNERFDVLYQTDRQLGQLFGFFTVLSILVASLGLFGMAAFTAKQQIKEVGIRKVLGASVQSIVGLLSKDFLKLVLIGFVIAVPVAWFAMQQWLADFAYRVGLEWWVFALAGLVATLIALLTISSQSIRAALANPVDSLRNE